MIIIEIYKTVKLKINCNNGDLKRLQMCNFESAKVWNSILEKNKDNYFNNAKLYSDSELKSLAKDVESQVICSNNKQIIATKLFDAYNSISKARKVGRLDLKYPWKIKKYYQTEWNKNYMRFDCVKNQILLTTTRYIDEKNVARNGKHIRIWFKTLLPQNIKTLKLIFENGCYYASISYLQEIREATTFFNNKASIDLGEIHAITSVDNNQNQLIITGRKIRSIKQFRNKKQAELRSKIDKCKNGSKQRNKYRIAYAKIRSKTRSQLDYSTHKLTRMYTNWAIEKGISVVYCGDVTNIELSTNKSGSSNTRQKINQWEYGRVMNLLENKLSSEGIQFKKVNEAYSSQICPCCGFKSKTKSRNYKCKNCEEEFHRDIVGAWNILNFNHKLVNVPNGNIKYLRIV